MGWSKRAAAEEKEKVEMPTPPPARTAGPTARPAVLSPRGRRRVRSHCRFDHRGIECSSESGTKRMNGSTKRQCDRARGRRGHSRLPLACIHIASLSLYTDMLRSRKVMRAPPLVHSRGSGSSSARRCSAAPRACCSLPRWAVARAAQAAPRSRVSPSWVFLRRATRTQGQSTLRAHPAPPPRRPA